MKKLFCILLCYCSLCQAQEYADYKLSDYKLPDIKRSSLDFKLHSDGSFATHETSDNTVYYDIKGAIDATFNRYCTTRKFIGDQSARIYFAGFKNNSTRDENGENYKQSNLNTEISYVNDSRFYIRPNTWFWFVGGDVSFTYYQNKAKDTEKELGIFIRPKLGLGWGRIERVQDARQAVYLLDKFSDYGLMKKHLSNEEVNRFAQLISTVKNKRFLDSRLHLIDEITTVDSFLIANDYIRKEGAKYFTTLYDYWLYGDLHQRKSGFEVGLEGMPEYNYYTCSNFNQKNHEPGITVSLSAEYEKPINLRWQHSASLNFMFLYMHNTFEADYADKTVYEQSLEHLQTTYTLGYNPNSRTYASLGVYNICRFANNHKLLKHFFDSGFRGKAYYYFSPQFRLEASAEIGYQVTNKEAGPDRWEGTYMLTLNYSFF